MITIQQIDNLLETKFAKFENRIVKSLTSSIDDNSGIIKEVKINVTEKHDSSAVLPPSVIPSSSAVNSPSMLASMVPSSSPVTSLPAKSAQSVYDEFADLQIKQVHDLHYNIYSTIILSNSNRYIYHTFSV